MGAHGPPATAPAARVERSWLGIGVRERVGREVGGTYTEKSSLSLWEGGGNVIEISRMSGVGVFERGGGMGSAVVESEKATMANGMARAWAPNMVARPAPASINGRGTRGLVWAPELAL